MKFLLDENIAQSITRNLIESGFDAIHIADANLIGATDDEVIAFARKKRLVVITHDKDFGNLIRYPIKNHYGVVILRFRNQKPKNTFPYLLNFLTSHKNLKSRLAILREDGYRII